MVTHGVCLPFSDLMNTSPPPTYVRVRFEQVDKDHSKVELTHSPKWLVEVLN